jgi:hypothetical protein
VEVVTDNADVAVSGGKAARPFPALTLPEGGLELVSEPFTEAAELRPPALAEFNEYMDDVDILFVSRSELDPLCLTAGSGNDGYLYESIILPAANFGVSESSIANSGRGLPVLVVQTSEASDGLRACVKVDEGRDFTVSLAEGGGIEMLTRSAYTSVVPGSACRPFLPADELSIEAEDSL